LQNDEQIVIASIEYGPGEFHAWRADNETAWWRGFKPVHLNAGRAPSPTENGTWPPGQQPT